MDKCYWIAVSGRMARTNCGDYLYLTKSNLLDEREELEPYVGSTCPYCGGKVYIDEHSYDLIKGES